MKKLVFFLAAAAIALYFVQTPDTDPIEMEAKYTSSASAFVESSTGLRVHYRDEGPRDGVPLVLIHGNGGSLHHWEEIAPALAQTHRVVTLTLAGHGLTGPGPDDDYTYDGLARSVDLVVQKLGLENFDLAGNSMGGWIAWRYALDHPDRIRALILIDASGAPIPEDEARAKVPLAYTLMKNPVGRFVAERFTPRSIVASTSKNYVAVKEAMTDEVIDRHWELLRYPGNRRAAGLRALVDREAHYAKRLNEIDAPTLILWGEEDIQTPVSMTRSYAEQIPHAKVIIYEDIGHLPMIEAPNRVAADMLLFLESLNSE